MTITTDNMSADGIHALADRFFNALREGDSQAVRDCYTDDVEVWHSHDRETLSLEPAIAGVEGFFASASDRGVEDVRRDILPDGFVQQHRLTGTLKDGSKLDIPVCMVCRVRDGRIYRLDEYLNT